MKTIDILHRTFVTGCMATTLYFSGFLVVRYRDIRRKANELEEFAAREKLTYPEAAAQAHAHHTLLPPPSLLQASRHEVMTEQNSQARARPANLRRPLSTMV
jgi:hypothetical protein